MGKIKLPQRLKDAHGDGIAEIQAPRLLPHGDADAAFVVCVQKFLGQTLRFTAEKEEAAVVVVRLGIAARRFGGKQPHLLDVIHGKKFRKVFINPHIDQMPVVQSRALDGAVRDVEAQRLDQMQHRAGRGTGTGDIAGVLRDLRRDENDVQHGFSDGTVNSGGRSSRAACIIL